MPVERAPDRARGVTSNNSSWMVLLAGVLTALGVIGFDNQSHAQGHALNKTTEARAEGLRTSLGAVPIAGGDSDIGFGIGQISEITRHVPGYKPYRFRIEDSAFLTFDRRDDRIRIPYQDYYVLFTVPDLIKNQLRLEIRCSYTHETTQKYYGLGNASKPSPTVDPNASYYEYGRIHPTLFVRARVHLARGWFLQSGVSYTHNWLHRREQSKLSEDMRTAGSHVRALLGDTRSHGVMLFEHALLYDTRDDETSTRHGQYHQLKLRLSPGGTGLFPYRYGQVNGTLRWYASPAGRFLTIAARTVADIQWGNPPFYELARFEDTFALGGSLGVRGVPAQRYYGKLKFFGNLELRSEVYEVRMFGKALRLGIAAFGDAGRVFVDFARRESLDGAGIGLKYGIGGGVRVQQGKTFVIRLDVAYSPDARPVGVYFGAGQIF